MLALTREVLHQVRPIRFSAYSAIPQKNLVSFFGKDGLFIAYSSGFGGASLIFANVTYLHPQENASAVPADVPWRTGENSCVTCPWYKWYQQSADISTGLPIGAVNSLSPITYWAVNIFNKTWSTGGQGADSWAVLSSHSNDLSILSLTSVLNSSPVEISQTTLVVVVLIPRDSLWGTSTRTSYEVLAVVLALSLSAGALGIFFIILLTRGITSEARLKTSLFRQREATKQAENRSSHKSIMFANMSHDLRTPLAAILGLIDLCLCDVMESSELKSNLSQMKPCATNLLDILNSILDMSKIEAGKLVLEESEFDVLELLEEALEMFAVVGMMNGLEVVPDLPDDSIGKSPMVLGDPGRVKQILSNLLSNGVKFTSSGHVVLRAWRKPSIKADKGTGEDIKNM